MMHRAKQRKKLGFHGAGSRALSNRRLRTQYPVVGAKKRRRMHKLDEAAAWVDLNQVQAARPGRAPRVPACVADEIRERRREHEAWRRRHAELLRRAQAELEAGRVDVKEHDRLCLWLRVVPGHYSADEAWEFAWVRLRRNESS